MPQLGDHEILEEIGRGGMGRVFRARHLRLGRIVAIKVFLGSELDSELRQGRFRTEIEAAARLTHPNIVPIHEVGEQDGWSYYSMRLIEGGALRQRTQGRPLPFREAAGIMVTVARALQHAHERGVLHRDIKPGNILIDEEGQPYLTDFGLAKFAERDDGLTLSNSALGTPAYMAPEQASGRTREITTATDVYGLGALMYELLTGRPPFTGESVMGIARQVIEKDPVPPQRVNPGVPTELNVICLKCLEKDPIRRYASAGDVAADCERWLRHEPISARPPTPAVRLGKWVRRHPAQAALGGISVALLIAGVVGVFLQWRKTEAARVALGEALVEANAARVTSEQSLARMRWEDVERWLEEGQGGRSLSYLAYLIRKDPSNWQAVMYAQSIVDRNAFPSLAGAPIVPPVPSRTGPCLSTDGRRVVTVGWDDIVRIWDADSGKEIRRTQAEVGIRQVAAGSGAFVLATLDERGTLHAWPSWESEPVKMERIRAGSPQAIGFSADGSRLWVRLEEGIEVWHLKVRGAQLEKFVELPGAEGVSVSTDARRFLAWSGTEALFFDGGDIPSVRLRAHVRFAAGALSAGGERMALIDGPVMIRFRGGDGDGVEKFLEIGGAGNAWNHVVLNAEGSRATVGGTGFRLAFVDAESGTVLQQTMRHYYGGLQLKASDDGRCIVSWGMDEAVYAWDASTGRRLQAPVWLGYSGLDGVPHVSADGSRLLLHTRADRGQSELISVWERTRTLEPVHHPIPGNRHFDGSRISPNGRYGCLAPRLRCYIYELSTGEVVLDKATEANVYLQLFSPDHRHCYALTEAGHLYGWNIENGEELWEPNHQPGRIRPGDITSDGRWIIAGHDDGNIRVYDTSTGRVVQTFAHPGEVKVLRFSPDASNRFVSGSTDGVAHVWSLEEGRRLISFDKHTETVLSASWSPDSRHVATASYDSTVRVWDVATGRELFEPLKHVTWLSQVQYSPDGRFLATACRDNSARLWDARTGRPASSALRHESAVDVVRFTSDGRCLLTRDQAGFRFWDMELFLPVTVHHPEPAAGGLGLDAEPVRSVLGPSDDVVFLGINMDHGAYWTITRSSGQPPRWFPDFLECLSLSEHHESDNPRWIDPARILNVRAEIAADSRDNDHVRWARRVLGMD